MVVLNGKFREYKLDNGLYVALQETPTETIDLMAERQKAIDDDYSEKLQKAGDAMFGVKPLKTPKEAPHVNYLSKKKK